MSDLAARPDALRFFRERFGLDDRGLAAGLDAALERRVDHADLFVEVHHAGLGRARRGHREERRPPRRAGRGRARRWQASARATPTPTTSRVESVRLAAATARAISERVAHRRAGRRARAARRRATSTP